MPDVNEVRAFYERMYATGGDAPPKGFLGFLRQLLIGFETTREEAVLQLLRPGGRLLDLGCGDGLLANAARPRFVEVHGVELAAPRLARARASAALLFPGDARIAFTLGDACTSLPYRAAAFDAVATISVLEHVFDPYACVAELARVLRPGGQLVVEVPNVAWLPRRLSLLAGTFPSTSTEGGWDGGHLHYFTLGSLCELLAQGGFRVDGWTTAGVLAPLRRGWTALLGADLVVSATRS